MTDARRRALVRELDVIKRRLQTHGIEVAYSRGARSLSEHIADIKRRDAIELALVGPVKPLSSAQIRMLEGARDGDPYRGIRGQSAHGGAFGTVTSLVRRGLLTRDLELTAAGRAELKRRARPLR